MRRKRACVTLVVLAGMLVWPIQARGGAPPAKPATAAPAKPSTAAPAKPATAAPAATKPTTAAPAPEPVPKPAMDPEVEKRIDLLMDPAAKENARVQARDELARDKALLAKGSVDALLWLGEVAPKLPLDDEQKPYVRMQVAIALSHLGRRQDVGPVVGKYDVLKEWLEGEDTAVRHWTALAIANTRTAAALDILGALLAKPSEDESAQITRRAVARAVGGWRGDSLKLALPMLLKLLDSKGVNIRVAAIEGLGATEIQEAEVVKPLAAIVSGGLDEQVRRAAEHALNDLTKGWAIRRLAIPVGATPAERKEKVRVWLFYWERAAKERAEKK